MNREQRIFVLIFCLVLFITICLIQFSPKTKVKLVSSKPFRGCIASLIRDDELVSANKLNNMLHSLRLFFVNLQNYTIHLFHEANLSDSIKQRILLCTSLKNIEFHQISFDIPFENNRSGYSSMCQFWSYDIWFKHDFIVNHCDYLIRFDDDSYLIDSTRYDLFEEFHRQKLDYVYRVLYQDTNGLEFLKTNIRQFLPANSTRTFCLGKSCTSLTSEAGYNGLAVYNNFFLIRVRLFYEHQIVKDFLQQLVSSKAFYHHRIGDANIQAISLMLIEQPVKIEFWSFPYNHNIHGSADHHPSYLFHHHSSFMWSFQMRIPNSTCQKLLIATKMGIIERYI